MSNYYLARSKVRKPKASDSLLEEKDTIADFLKRALYSMLM